MCLSSFVMALGSSSEIFFLPPNVFVIGSEGSDASYWKSSLTKFFVIRNALLLIVSLLIFLELLVLHFFYNTFVFLKRSYFVQMININIGV